MIGLFKIGVLLGTKGVVELKESISKVKLVSESGIDILTINLI